MDSLGYIYERVGWILKDIYLGVGKMDSPGYIKELVGRILQNISRSW